MDKKEVFRNTRDWYLETKNDKVYDKLFKFAIQHSGETILDVGCATGDYCNKLKNHGFKCVGVDINQKYVDKAIGKGIEAYLMDAEDLDLPDNSFDTVLLFEVLEHVKRPNLVLSEANRVAKKNVLITVPNVTEFSRLKEYRLTYDHMLDQDHVNFFTKQDLEELLSREFSKFKVDEREVIGMGLIDLPVWLSYPILALYKLKIIKSSIYYRLYAIASV